jgi:hypothetical protein
MDLSGYFKIKNNLGLLILVKIIFGLGKMSLMKFLMDKEFLLIKIKIRMIFK